VLTDLMPCSKYHIRLVAVTAQGLVSPSARLDVSTLFDHPGPVQDLRVSQVGLNFITVEFNPPTQNTACFQGYDAKCHEWQPTTTTPTAAPTAAQMKQWNISKSEISASSSTMTPSSTTSPEPGQLTSTCTGLQSCTKYTYEISSIAHDGSESAWESVDASTVAESLSAPQEFMLEATEARSAILSWYCPLEGCRCVDRFLIHWTLSETATTTQTTRATTTTTTNAPTAKPTTSFKTTIMSDGTTVSTTPDTTSVVGIMETREDMDEMDENTKWVNGTELETTIGGLLPCSNYTVTIQAFTHADPPVGGEEASLSLQTKEAAPGKVRALQETGLSQTGFEARWQDPLVDPQCTQDFRTLVQESACPSIRQKNSVDMAWTNRPLDIYASDRVLGSRPWHHYSNDSLLCDTCYTFSVTAASASGILGPSDSIPIWTDEC